MDYSFSKSFISNFTGNISEADKMALRYDLFPGSIYLKSDKADIILDWDWIPLLDFSICLLSICSNLLKKLIGVEEFDFTESGAKIIFIRHADMVKISSSFSEKILNISFEEFQKTVRKFYKAIVFQYSGNYICGKVQN